mgnify:CR=1 FL=1
MNIYKLHKKPSSLLHHDAAHSLIPRLVWEKYMGNPAELKKREAVIATDANYAYMYARDVIRGPFPKGEEAIAKDAHCAQWYANDVLKGPWPKGEAAIAENAHYSRSYAQVILKADFYYDGKLIAKAE